MVLTSWEAVVFQLSQIGSDEDSKTFLTGLDKDMRLKGILYVTARELGRCFIFQESATDMKSQNNWIQNSESSGETRTISKLG